MKPTQGEVKLPSGETLKFYRWDLGEFKLLFLAASTFVTSMCRSCSRSG
jgi:hypothetical protein